jgi:hypothetical protein
MFEVRVDCLSPMNEQSNMTAGNLTDLIPDIAYSKARGLGYIGGEMNSLACKYRQSTCMYLSNIRSTGHGAPGVSNTAGAALWTLDYTLFAATLGITQVFFHEGIGFKVRSQPS